MPVVIVMVGAFSYLVYYVAALWHAVYLIRNDGVIDDETNSKFHIAEWLGTVGLLLNWIFIFFLMARLNDETRCDYNPTF